MFKNLTVYRIGPDGSPDLTEIEAGLSKGRFVECGATQQRSSGWVEPRGVEHGPLVESVGGQLLLKLRTEQRVVPGAVIKRRTEELAQNIELQTGRKPGKKQTKELKEQALLELLPMAFTKQSSTQVWIDPVQRLLLVDASSQSRADDVVSTLVKSLDGRMAVSQLNTAESPAVCMAEWLSSGEPPGGFSIDRECELKSSDAQKAVVRYTRHRLDTEEVRQHILTGKTPTKLAMTWRDRVSFMLTDAFQIKKLAFLDVVFEAHKGSNKPAQDEAFDADVAIATGELCQLLPDLLDALGGEQDMSGGGASASRSAEPSTDARPSGDHAPAEPATTADDSPPW
ncbi:MAG TPA: recombination-associated protein RdgC [Aquabacterium sp.]|uniref:recombination-associated protein RdgC n=1 Tax=Aquabacterium sp. TaxID=1872578 RepID=UPI002E36BCAE|nr:recombination-associated protein RdgC [Aquabacterium sp.]HEX5371578.1 recombination-associated protein RdgC [Aquabacterium sp.]